MVMEEGFTPALHSILQEANPKEYEKWQGNACRQAAILSIPMLRELLPNYTWAAWDGWFDDIVHGKNVHYNHAWVYGRDKETGRKLLVDLARQHHERLFVLVDSNRYPKDHPEYVNMKEVRRERLDIDNNLRDIEYYTKLKGYQLLQLVRERMAREILK
jgi:hypothetical protein